MGVPEGLGGEATTRHQDFFGSQKCSAREGNAVSTIQGSLSQRGCIFQENKICVQIVTLKIDVCEAVCPRMVSPPRPVLLCSAGPTPVRGWGAAHPAVRKAGLSSAPCPGTVDAGVTISTSAVPTHSKQALN